MALIAPLRAENKKGRQSSIPAQNALKRLASAANCAWLKEATWLIAVDILPDSPRRIAPLAVQLLAFYVMAVAIPLEIIFAHAK